MTTYTIKATRTYWNVDIDNLEPVSYELPEFQLDCATRVQACLFAGSLLGADNEDVSHDIEVSIYTPEGEETDAPNS